LCLHGWHILTSLIFSFICSPYILLNNRLAKQSFDKLHVRQCSYCPVYFFFFANYLSNHCILKTLNNEVANRNILLHLRLRKQKFSGSRCGYSTVFGLYCAKNTNWFVLMQLRLQFQQDNSFGSLQLRLHSN
jgi:hypothetical protein